MMQTVLQVAIIAIAAGGLLMGVLSVLGRRRAATRVASPKAARSTSPEPDRTTWRSAPEPRIDNNGNISSYRVRPGSSQAADRWDPYDEEQSRRHRVQAARRKPRPERGGSRPRFTPAAPERTLSHYATLGVRPDATQEEIERAYRRYAAEVHPDRFFDDPVRRRQAEARLKELNAIMQVLRDPERRRRYDESR